MPYLEKIDVSEGVDVNKRSASKEGNLCLYWYFLVLSSNRMSKIDAMIY